jgi:hypothetical protein
MELPQIENQITQRAITGEIVYLDEMRRQNEEPRPFLDLADMAIQMYEAQADMYPAGERPSIMDEYEQYDDKPSEVVANCAALADILLTLKEPESQFTFVDIAVEASPEIVLKKLEATSVGSILAGGDEQLAIPSDGEYYPVLDMRKQNAILTGVGLRAWGWDDQKYIFTNQQDEQYEYPKHALVYPSDEKSSTRQIELFFSYNGTKPTSFTESISLQLTNGGSARISSNIWAMAYAETGYEGHGGSSLQNLKDEDIIAFAELVAEIVGDEPESVSMKINQRLQELADTAVTPPAKQSVQSLIEITWPAQAHYFLTRKQTDTDQTIAEQLLDETTVDTAVAAINTIIAEWKVKRS